MKAPRTSRFCKSIVTTCQLHGVNPETYLADVLVRVQPDCNVEPLMPWNWSPKASLNRRSWGSCAPSDVVVFR